MTAIDWDKMTETLAAVRDGDSAAAVLGPGPALEFFTLAALRARVSAAGPRRWLLRGVWPAGDYGVHAAEMKAQKTWTTVDAAVSVPSGTPWLGVVDVDDPGPVVMFHGEGSEPDLVRRIDAVCASRGLEPDALPITVCTRVPHLSRRGHLDVMADQLDRVRPRLVTLDPLYLAARGAKGSDLFAMGELLEPVQHLCQDAGAALWVTHHHNRKDGRGAARISGAGAAEWGRVLITGTVISRHGDTESGESVVITELDVIGGSVLDQSWRVTRRIRADDPDDLDSPLTYDVHAHPAEHGGSDDMPPARRKLLDALKAADGNPRTGAQLVDAIAETHGHGLRRETVSKHLNALLADGLADRIDPGGVGVTALWVATTEGDGK